MDISAISQLLSVKPESVDLIDSKALSKKTLPENFIDKHSDALDWTVISNCQPLTPYLINKYSHLVKFNELAYNKNLPAETITSVIDRIDFEASQKHNKYTPEMITQWLDICDHDLIIKHQTLNTEIMKKILEQFIFEQMYLVAKDKIDNMLRFQKLEESFLEYLLKLEQESQTILVDKRILVKTQTLSESFIESHLTLTKDILNLVFEYQKLTLPFIQKYMFSVDQSIVLHKELDEKTIKKVLDFTHTQGVDSYKSSLISVSKNQMFGYTFLDDISMVVVDRSVVSETTETTETTETSTIVDLRDDKKFIKKFYTNIFMRTLDPEDQHFINWTTDIVMKYLIPEISWFEICHIHLNPNQIDSVIELGTSSEYKRMIPWYVLMRHNTITIDQVNTAVKNQLFGAIELWFAVTTYNLDDEIAIANYHKWWLYISDDQKAGFVSMCLDSITFTSKYNLTMIELERKNVIGMFLTDYISKTNWTTLLREEQLPEWMISIFGQLSSIINHNLNGVDYWWKVSRYQTLSPEFIRNNIDDLDLLTIMTWQKVPHDLIIELQEFMDIECINAAVQYQGYKQ